MTVHQPVELAQDIEAIRAKLLQTVSGEGPSYAVRVEVADDTREGDAADLMASHTVYTRSSY